MKISSSLTSMIAIGVVGCSSLPTAGPTTSQIIDQAATESGRHFDMVNVDNRVVAVLRAQPGASLRTRFEKYGKPPPAKISVGDTASIAIYSSAALGLFGAAPAQPTPAVPATGAGSLTFPEQVVAPDGAITVPYAGRVRVAGRTPLQVQQTIDQRLAQRVVEPQSIVTITRSVSNTVTVSGEVVNGAQIPLSVRGERLLDIIAAAGGAKAPLYETFVRLSRDGVTATIPMDTLVSDPRENIYAWPGDVLTLVRAPQTFSTFGATGFDSQFPFNADRINLAQAIAKAGGLQDTRADPAGVFLFRFEPPSVANALNAPTLATAPSDGRTPILYHLDLQQADAYFLAKRFPVKDDDLIYVANARATDLQKFFTLLSTLTGPVISGVVVTRGSP